MIVGTASALPAVCPSSSSSSSSSCAGVHGSFNQSICAAHVVARGVFTAAEQIIAKFHYVGPTGPDRTARTRTDFFAARVSEKLRWVRAVLRQSLVGPCGSAWVRSGPCSGIWPLLNWTIVDRHREEIRWRRLKMRELMLKYNGILGLIL